ncbi:S-layer homology domain-containing protein [Tepidibacter hydrothermalis]|uniref:S-layer homology domain-containing protein n=1 Tax=Tepidibacter hydrothermalis TaxID=3036126 RepID=A0ABY8EEV6_9FIRM|nr:S-layer homology domain-containing protein [Tepidibacter hydrothermalis]WFD11480.1 S-layer homology domain-containing protein [Tepidibacter hydrothermalis]
MKKIVSFILAVALILPMSLTSSYAHSKHKFIPPGLAKKGGLPPGIAKRFRDIDEYKWAEKSIERMYLKGIIKGMSDNEFAPSKNVTKIESLAMIIRTMGWDDEADECLDLIKKGKKKDKLEKKLQDWGKGYIEVALDKGLIDEVDIWQNNFTAPATRQEVAKYIIRALGYEKEAQEYMKEDLRFKDTSAVQIGNVGYIYLIDKKDIMSGYPDNTFRPNQSVKRAEMAKLVDNLDEKLNDEEVEEDDDKDEVENKDIFEGKLIELDLEDEEIVVKVDNKEKLFEIENNTVIKIDNKEENIEDLYVGMNVKIIVEDEKVVKVYAYYDEEEYKGTILSVDIEENELEIKIDDIEKTFKIDEDADIELDDENVKLEKLQKGMEVEIELKDGKIIEINAESIEQEYEGKIVEKIEGKINKLSIKIDNTTETFEVDEDVEIEFEDEEDGEFKDLKVGSEIEIKVVNNVIVEIEVQD